MLNLVYITPNNNNKAKQLRGNFFRSFRHVLGAKPKFFGPFWCHLYLFGAEEIPLNDLSYLFNIKTHHEK